VFVSYATADRKDALAVCKAIERRGLDCWISTRDVAPGQNYQEAIVRSLRGARAMVLVFSEAANNSDEIKKELSLASRYRIPVMAVRIEDVEPSDAFAYELSTRQWIDAFNGWDKSIDALASQLKAAATDEGATPPEVARARVSPRKAASPMMMVLAAIAVILLAGTAWLFLRPNAAVAHTMQVRLTGFDKLSADLPAGMPDAIRDEIVTAFANDGTIGVSTASSPPAGTAPAYGLGGTIRRDGNKIKVIARLVNERSGTSLWSQGFDYDYDKASAVPRRIAVAAGNMARCGLFAASTYPKALPDRVFADYLQYCRYSGWLEYQATRALDFAQKVVAAAPDFSWGWSAVESSAMLALSVDTDPADAAAHRAIGLAAAEKALKLDPTNSEAYGAKSLLGDPGDLIGREKLLKQAVAARPLSCGCEHFIYGMMLKEVGRLADSSTQLRRATELNPLDADIQWSFADALLARGLKQEAKPHLDLTIDLAKSPNYANNITVSEALLTGDTVNALRALRDSNVDVTDDERGALVEGFEALRSRDAAAKSRAIQHLAALKVGADTSITSGLVAALGDDRVALNLITEEALKGTWGARSWFFYPQMASALRNPAFPGIANRLGLMKYWRSTHTRPDACTATDPPPFCRII
jgi:tetratricopeptide (TPR) repeat protein